MAVSSIAKWLTSKLARVHREHQHSYEWRLPSGRIYPPIIIRGWKCQPEKTWYKCKGCDHVRVITSIRYEQIKTNPPNLTWEEATGEKDGS